MLLAPWFLAGLLAIGVPLWLHRIARTERIRMPFASLMLLEASEVRDTSRRSLRYWLLLAVRIALLVLLAFAFAQPLLKMNNTTSESAQSQLQAIVIDTSLSMQYQGRWQRAVEQASTLIDNLKSGDRALLVAASGRKVELIAGPVFANDAAALRAALATLKPSLDRLDYGLFMTSSSVWLSAEGLPTHLHFITDMQQSASPLRFADLAPPANTAVELHDVGAGTQSDNLAVVSATVRGAEDRILTATVRGNADYKASRELMLSIDGNKVASKQVMLDKSGVAQIIFPAPKLRAGSHRLQFDLQPNDALPQDDSYYAVIEHSEPTVLLIAQDQATDEAAYLAAAIESQTAMHLTVERTTPQTLPAILAAHPLSDYSAVFVSDSGVLTSSIAHQLAQYVEAGGAVLATLGPRAAQLAAEPITGMTLHKSTDSELRVATIDDSHPVLRDASGWRAVRFMKHIDVRLSEYDRALITLGNQSPLLIERNNSAGKLLLLAAPLDRAWNDLAIHPLFVRFIAAAARYLTDRDVSAMAYTVDSRIATGLSAGTGGQIFDPLGARVLALDDAGGANHLTPSQIGFYEVRSSQQKRWIAVNVDARESDLSSMSAESVTRWQSLTSSSIASSAMNKTQIAAKAKIEHAFGWNLLIAVAMLLLLELLLANYRLTIRRDGANVVATDGAS